MPAEVASEKQSLLLVVAKRDVKLTSRALMDSGGIIEVTADLIFNKCQGSERAHPHALHSGALSKLLIFNSMDNQSQRMLVQNMYKRQVTAGEILVDQGSTGLAATQLYVIESGSFEILQKRQGYTVRVDLDHPGRCLGEISLYYDWARNAAIVAKSRAVVWIHHPEESNDFSTSAITAEHHAGVSNQPRDQIGSSDCEAPSEFGKSTLP
ncbi:uncharacterized protein HaLaN_11227, partial [Haematococcus lacustris]